MRAAKPPTRDCCCTSAWKIPGLVIRALVSIGFVIGFVASQRSMADETRGRKLADILLNQLPEVAQSKARPGCIQIYNTVPETIDGLPLNPLAAQHREGTAFIRNRDCWAPVDLTPISACQFDANPHRRTWTARLGMTLISPRHVLCAKHDGLGETRVIFVSRSNQEIRRRVIDTETVKTANVEDDGRAVDSDFVVGLLDQPIEDQKEGVGFARILPLDMLPSLRHGVVAPFIPVMHTNQEREVRVLDWVSVGRSHFKCDLFFSTPGELELFRFYKAVHPGDSGSPLFTSIDGQFILLSVFHTAVQGSSVSLLRTEIEQAMSNLDHRNGWEGKVGLAEADVIGYSGSLSGNRMP